MSDYDETPSFYNSEEMFSKYLGQTSYYLGLQQAVAELVGFVSPDSVLELGSGTGETAIRLAETYPDTNIKTIDIREEPIKTAQEQNTRQNLVFSTGDMTQYVADADTLPPMLVLLYSFHHINDPLKKKTTFLEQCYELLPNGGHICIAEGFISELPDNPISESDIRELWAKRGLEAYASTFWASLDGVGQNDIEKAQGVGEFSKEHEIEAGENVASRTDEYLVTRQWLVRTAESVGFSVVLSEPVNSLGEGVVLLRK